MRKFLLALICTTGLIAAQAQQTFTVNTSGFQFVPATVTITQGDTVEFAQSASHPAREVSQSTWNANGSTSNGGFDNAHSGTKIKFNTPGTYYYVCSVHFGSGMKGQIVVNASTTSVEEAKANVTINAYPSPVVSNLNVNLNLVKSEVLTIEVFNIIGENIYSVPATNYTSGKNSVNIDFSEFSNGAYFIKVIGKDEQYTMKILK